MFIILHLTIIVKEFIKKNSEAKIIIMENKNKIHALNIIGVGKKIIDNIIKNFNKYF